MPEYALTLFMTEGRRSFPTSFSLIISTNVGIRPKNFLAFNFNLFATLEQNFKAIPNASPKSLNFKKYHSSKKSGFSG